MISRDGIVEYQPIRVAFSFNQGRPETGLPDREWVVLEEQFPTGTTVLIEGSRTIAQGTRVDPVLVPRARQAGAQP
jgi:hypothetical protein